MKIRYSVTWEYETRAPETMTGEVEAVTVSTAARRALEAARKEAKPIGWSSVVCLLERSREKAAGSSPEASGDDEDG